MQENALRVSWDMLHRDARTLARQLVANGRRWESIVCITRGGLVPTAIIARELGIRVIDTVCVSSYHDYENQGKLMLLKQIDTAIIGDSGGEKVLVIDELVDTGSTAAFVREMLPKAHIATVYAKPQGQQQVDTFVTGVSQDTWIYFPWDTALQFVPPIQDGN